MDDVLTRTLEGLRSALTLSPQNGPLWLQVAKILRELGRDNEAREAAEEAIRHASGDEALRDEARAIAGGRDDEQAPGSVLRLIRGGSARIRDREVSPLERPSVDFSDVGGMDAIKDDIRMKIVLPFKKPDLFRRFGKKQGGGLLLYGPPGCGKTLLARATAGECQASFLNAAIESVLDMWFGESERKLAALFESARKASPSVLFFDEIEAIGGSRQLVRHSPGKTLVNQLLAEMDGVANSNDRLLVMAATNAPWHVDSALRRPGRFDRVVFVPPPDRSARLDILRLHLRDRPVSSDVDLSELAKQTERFSGADLFELVERAIERPLKEALQGKPERALSMADLKAALAASKPSTVEWFATAKNYATFSNVGGLYDDLLVYLKSPR